MSPTGNQKSERLCSPRHAGAAAMALCAALPAIAQQQVATIEEAAQINAGLAMQICIAPGPVQQTLAQFRAAGFAETVQRSTTNSDTTHTFSAPLGSARAEFYYGEMPSSCDVYSEHMGVTVGSAILDQIVPRIYPGYTRRVEFGAPGANGQPAQCVRYEDPANPIGDAIGVEAPGQGCVETGSVRFFIFSRV